MDASNKVSLQKYGRDVLLQLRMHPLSLKKPDIQKLDVVKDKLYLHQINNNNNTSTAILANGSPDSFYGSLKFETENKLCCPRNYQDFFPWRCSLNGCGKKVNTMAHHGMLPCKKWQVPLANHISPLRKNGLVLSDLQYDSSIDDDFSNYVVNSPLSSWSKQCCTTFDPQSKANSKADVKNEKKVLPIIDPSNGKNILDSIIKNSPSTEDNTKEGDSVVTKTQNMMSESGDHVSETGEHHLVSNQECGDSVQSMTSDEGSMCQSPSSRSKEFSDSSSAFNSSCEEKEKLYCVNNSTTDNNSTSNDSYEESEKEIFKEDDTAKFNLNNLNEGVEKFENQQKLNLMLLKEKLYSMKKEQQRMAVLQNILRFKKRQIDESLRNLDEKRIEIANWECTLLNKAKELQEKECWLETKKLTLRNKAQKLEEKEKALNRKESFLNDKAKKSSKPTENGKSGTENDINPEELANSDHGSVDDNCDCSMNNLVDDSMNNLVDGSMNNLANGSLKSDKSGESLTEASSV